ncbi:MAG: flippase-like domain-containing protein [candidate division WOR-3 bacterium]|nr:MAG: flippase-like domain-containing protein [candidate division WOR-3 bacterium]
MRSEKHKVLLTTARVVVGVGLVIFLLWTLDIQEIFDHILQVRSDYLIYAAVVYFVFIIVSAWRWQVLLAFKKFRVPFTQTLRIYFISLFFNNLLPTTVGGDMMRVVYTMKGRRADSLATVLVDRILGFVGLFILALIAVVYLLVLRSETEFLPFMVIGLSVIVAITYVFFSRKAFGVLSPIFGRLRFMRLGERINRLHEAGTDFGGAWGPIILCVVHSLVIQAALSVAPFFVLRGMGYSEVGLLPFFIYVPIINVISMLPVSLNGLGVRENSYVILFSRVGLSGELALAMSLLSFFIIFAYSLLGGVFFAFTRRHQSNR